MKPTRRSQPEESAPSTPAADAAAPLALEIDENAALMEVCKTESEQLRAELAKLTKRRDRLLLAARKGDASARTDLEALRARLAPLRERVDEADAEVRQRQDLAVELRARARAATIAEKDREVQEALAEQLAQADQVTQALEAAAAVLRNAIALGLATYGLATEARSLRVEGLGDSEAGVVPEVSYRNVVPTDLIARVMNIAFAGILPDFSGVESLAFEGHSFRDLLAEGTAHPSALGLPVGQTKREEVEA